MLRILLFVSLLISPSQGAVPNAAKIDELFENFDIFVNSGNALNISGLLHPRYMRSPPCGGEKVYKAAEVSNLSKLPRGIEYSTHVYETMEDVTFFLVRVTFTNLFGKGKANVIVDKKPNDYKIMAIYEREPAGGCAR